MTAGVDDEGLRREQGFDVVEQEQPLTAVRDQSRGGRREGGGGAGDFRGQRRDARVTRGRLRATQRRARVRCS